ncbi:MAG: hypothetical protein K9W44_00715 [Candidatus Lokiarchaeota archaeon]|nr:hypothetical protein [Candidatus Harpocratesius repetitus]
MKRKYVAYILISIILSSSIIVVIILMQNDALNKDLSLQDGKDYYDSLGADLGYLNETDNIYASFASKWNGFYQVLKISINFDSIQTYTRIEIVYYILHSNSKDVFLMVNYQNCKNLSIPIKLSEGSNTLMVKNGDFSNTDNITGITLFKKNFLDDFTLQVDYLQAF